MELIVGGSGQGKLDCAIRHMKEAGQGEPEIWTASALADRICGNAGAAGTVLPKHEGGSGPVIVTELQEFARQEQSEERLREFAEQVIQSAESCIFVCDEVGCGVVPVDAEERAWRDRTGRLCCYLAARAGAVTRVLCGLEQVIRREAYDKESDNRRGQAEYESILDTSRNMQR